MSDEVEVVEKGERWGAVGGMKEGERGLEDPRG